MIYRFKQLIHYLVYKQFLAINYYFASSFELHHRELPAAAAFSHITGHRFDINYLKKETVHQFHYGAFL
jgi:hypothetical protein